MCLGLSNASLTVRRKENHVHAYSILHNVIIRYVLSIEVIRITSFVYTLSIRYLFGAFENSDVFHRVLSQLFIQRRLHLTIFWLVYIQRDTRGTVLPRILAHGMQNICPLVVLVLTVVYT